MSKVVYKASFWDSQDFYIRKTKRNCMTGKLNILRGLQLPVMHLLSQTTSRQLISVIPGSAATLKGSD